MPNLRIECDRLPGLVHPDPHAAGNIRVAAAVFIVFVAIIGTGVWVWIRFPVEPRVIRLATSAPAASAPGTQAERDDRKGAASDQRQESGAPSAQSRTEPRAVSAGSARSQPNEKQPPAYSPSRVTGSEADPATVSRTDDAAVARGSAAGDGLPVSGPTYDASTVGVSPPAAINPRMLGILSTSSPGVRHDILTILVVVSERGTVDSVRALNVPSSLGESVLLTSALAAVKTWQFRPAMKDGVPVRYRHIVPLRVAVGSTP